MFAYGLRYGKSLLRVLLTVFVLSSSSSMAQTIQWEPERQITFDSTDIFISRVFATGDTVHIFWQRFPHMIYYSRSTDGGETFSGALSITSDTTFNSVGIIGRVAH